VANVELYRPVTCSSPIMTLRHARAQELGPWLDFVAAKGEIFVQFWLRPGEQAAAFEVGDGPPEDVGPGDVVLIPPVRGDGRGFAPVRPRTARLHPQPAEASCRHRRSGASRLAAARLGAGPGRVMPHGPSRRRASRNERIPPKLPAWPLALRAQFASPPAPCAPPCAGRGPGRCARVGGKTKGLKHKRTDLYPACFEASRVTP